VEKNDLKAMAAVFEASKAVFSDMKIETLQPVIASAAQKLIQADDISIVLLLEDGTLSLAAGVGDTNLNWRKQVLDAAEKLMAEARQSKSWEPVVLSGREKPDNGFKTAASAAGARLAFPLVMNGTLLGMLMAARGHAKPPFDNRDLRHATIFCSQISQSVQNANLFERLQSTVEKLKETNERLELTQAQLVQTEKLAAIGELAAGVAHELNNPLTGVVGFTQLLLQDETLNAQQKEDLENIHKQSQRCRQIIQHLLQFSRRKEPKKELLDLAPLVKNTLELIQYELSSSGIGVESRLDENAPQVMGDPHQLQQVILNLATNALQALEGRPDARIILTVEKKGNKVRFTCADNGPGIRKDVLSKIFNPFFTTKPVGKGTGLGLSISYGIVKEHGGGIWAESEEGAGASFIVELPVHV
jgi:C4-dicarboxylate-specific signal transduction histidine kinase